MKQVKIIPNIEDIKDNDIFEIESSPSYYSHSMFKYPAKFTPEIPNWFLRNFTSENENILDCFCGSGTSLVEASIQNRKPLGIDFDPLSHLLTITKTSHLNSNEISEIKEIYKNLIKPSKNPFYPDLVNLEHWFNEPNITTLSNIYSNIIDLNLSNSKISNFFLTSFASIIRKSSYSDEVSPKPYVSTKLNKIPAISSNLFIKTIEKNLKIFEISKYQSNHIAKIIGSDSRKKTLYNQKVDHVITSPPYINSFDYVRILRLENLWLNNFSSEEILQHKQNQIGTENIYVDIYKKVPEVTKISNLDSIISDIYVCDKKRSHVVHKYFKDMEITFKVMQSTIKKDGYFCIVVGNCFIKGIEIKTYQFFIELLEQIGFEFIKHFSYIIKNPYLRIPRLGRGGLTMFDHIIVFKNNG